MTKIPDLQKLTHMWRHFRFLHNRHAWLKFFHMDISFSTNMIGQISGLISTIRTSENMKRALPSWVHICKIGHRFQYHQESLISITYNLW